MPLIPINGVRLYVEDSGTDAPSVVFSHGLLWNTRLFERQVEHLKSRYRCVAYDHRGQGLSDIPDGDCVAIETLYEDAVALIRHLGVGPVHFVGLSMGGFVGMRVAARRPELVRSLTLLETSAEPEDPAKVRRYKLLNFVAKHLGVGVVTDAVMPILFGRSCIEDPAREADRNRWRDILKTNKRSIYKAVNGVLSRRGVAEELANVRCPTLVIVGAEDVATPPAKAEHIQRLISGSTLVRIPAAGHSSTVEQPDLVNQALETHLDRAGGAQTHAAV